MFALIALLMTLLSVSLALPLAETPAPLVARGCEVGDPDPHVVDQIYQTCLQRGCNSKVMLVVFETCTIESNCNDLNCGDKDSLGPFQQRANWGSAEQRRNVPWSTNAFLDQAIPAEAKHSGWSAGQIAQAVQESEANANYNAAQSRAQKLISEAEARHGGGGGAVNVASAPKKPQPQAKPAPAPQVKAPSHSSTAAQAPAPSHTSSHFAEVPKNVAAGTTHECLEFAQVKWGDSVWALSQKFKSSIPRIMELNRGIHPDFKNLFADEAYCVRA